MRQFNIAKDVRNLHRLLVSWILLILFNADCYAHSHKLQEQVMKLLQIFKIALKVLILN